MTETEWLMWAALAAAGVALLVACFALIQNNTLRNELAASIQKQSVSTAEIISAYNDLQARVEECHTALMTIHQSIPAIQQELKKLEGKLREQAPNDPQIKLYQKATTMAQDGLSAEEIASACDLPLAEANLLVSLYTK